MVDGEKPVLVQLPWDRGTPTHFLCCLDKSKDKVRISDWIDLQSFEDMQEIVEDERKFATLKRKKDNMSTIII